ncbi:MAG TPA: PilZ domain-containing protein [Candidatus Acidoferrales bacterium]|nr:PilZ domain-containing protein [Candidatus Acidoferrales bacterium]
MDLSTEPKTRERRRGERVLIRVAIQINGTGKDGKPVHDSAEAVVVNRNGALLRVPNPLKSGSTLEVFQAQDKEVSLAFRVIWCSGRPREGRYDVGVELIKPSEELWGIRFPPLQPGAST